MGDDAAAATNAQITDQEKEPMASASVKRTAEGGTESEAAPDAKRQKTEPAVDAEGAATVGRVDADATAAEQPSGAATADDAAADTAAAAAAATEGAEDVGPSEGAEDGKEAAETVQPADPTVLAFRTFANGEECYTYFHELLTRLTPDQDLNEYEFNMVMDLLRKGHPNPDSKIGSGVRAIQIKRHQEMESTCYFVMRSDGTQEDFSYRKCIAKLFPEHEAKPPKGGSKPRAKGGRGGRGSGGRGGRGGRGRGRGGGRGGRGRGRRG